MLSLFLTDFTSGELAEAAAAAYTDGVFEEDWAAPLSDLSDGRFVLELWHARACAFKDMALQLLPHLMVPAARRALDGKQILILVATSGDTGKAALEGFCGVEGVKIAVFYPNDGVSPMQQLQMVTQRGENVAVYAIEGNFDNAQTEVKKIFTDPGVIAVWPSAARFFRRPTRSTGAVWFRRLSTISRPMPILSAANASSLATRSTLSFRLETSATSLQATMPSGWACRWAS